MAGLKCFSFCIYLISFSNNFKEKMHLKFYFQNILRSSNKQTKKMLLNYLSTHFISEEISTQTEIHEKKIKSFLLDLGMIKGRCPNNHEPNPNSHPK